MDRLYIHDGHVTMRRTCLWNFHGDTLISPPILNYFTFWVDNLICLTEAFKISRSSL